MPHDPHGSPDDDAATRPEPEPTDEAPDSEVEDEAAKLGDFA